MMSLTMGTNEWQLGFLVSAVTDPQCYPIHCRRECLCSHRIKAQDHAGIREICCKNPVEFLSKRGRRNGGEAWLHKHGQQRFTGLSKIRCLSRIEGPPEGPLPGDHSEPHHNHCSWRASLHPFISPSRPQIIATQDDFITEQKQQGLTLS